jgi:ATP-binding cassette subfamily C protein
MTLSTIRRAAGLLRSIPPGQIALLSALTLASALSEGVGLLMLVPMLSALSAGELAAGLPGWAASASTALAQWLGLGGLLALFVALVAARAVLNYRLALAQTRSQYAVVDDWRDRIYRALLSAGWRHLSAMRQSDNISLLIQLVDTIGDGIFRLLGLLTSVVTLGIVWLAAFALSPVTALVGALGGIAVLALFSRFRRHARGLGSDVVRGIGALHGEAQETLGALRLIKSHGQEGGAALRLSQNVGALRRAQLAMIRTTAGSRALLLSAGAVAMALVVWVAFARGVSLAVLLPLVALFARSVPLLDTLQSGLQHWSHALPAIERAESLLAQASAAREPDLPAAPAPRPLHEIAVTDATVCHDGRDSPALDDVTLALPAGSMTALVGPSGAGKSTLADLFGAMFAPDAGTLSVDGMPLDGAALVGWRRATAYLHQEPVLFHTTIRRNLQWARSDAGEAEMKRALERASAGFVLELPEGLDTVVGDAGCRLSGGERQRIALARALLGDPALLILDEATSALDAENDAAIARAIAGLKGQCTILVIGHRGALTDMADRVVTLRNGRIAGEGAIPSAS